LQPLYNSRNSSCISEGGRSNSWGFLYPLSTYFRDSLQHRKTPDTWLDVIVPCEEAPTNALSPVVKLQQILQDSLRTPAVSSLQGQNFSLVLIDHQGMTSGCYHQR